METRTSTRISRWITRTIQLNDRRAWIFGLLTGFLFAAMTACGASLHEADTIWRQSTLLWTLGLAPVFGILCMLLLQLLRQGDGSEKPEGSMVGKKGSGSLDRAAKRRWFLMCWLLLFLSWVPVFLASWPGIFSYDCGWQLATYVEGTVNGHHPILHTFLLGICRDMGYALGGSNQTGAYMYSLIQMLLMSAMYADVCLFLKERCTPRWLQLLAFLFLAFHPVNSLMALCATKDSIFTAVFLMFLVQLFRLAEEPEEFFSSVPRQFLFVITVWFLFAFRNNGFHTFLLSAPFLLLAFRKYWKRMGILILVCLCLYGLYTGPVYQALGIEKGDPREMCCVLMQSAARVYQKDPSGLTEEEREAFLSIIEEEGMDSYLSWFADPVKAYFNGEKFAENPGPFLKAWISAGMRHKKIYIDSFLANTYGYWYPGDTTRDTKNGRDYFEYYCKDFQENIDVEMESKLPALSEFYRKLGNESSFEQVPVVRLTFRLGTYTWLLIFTFVLLLYRKQYDRLILLVPLAAYFATNLLGPVVKMRYHYPLMACAPLILYLIWKRPSSVETAEQERRRTTHGQDSSARSLLQREQNSKKSRRGFPACAPGGDRLCL